MDWVNIAFWIFASIAAVSAGAVISVRNSVYAVLCLILTFFSIACVWLLVGAEFLGVTLVLVYVGAVMVLFLFVVMMLDIDTARLRQGWVRYLPVGLLVAVAMLVQMVTLIGVKARTAAPFPADNAAAQAADSSNITWLAKALFTQFLLPFEFAAIILTVAVVAAVMLTLRKRTGIKTQNPGEQARVKAGDRLRMVKMQAERPTLHTQAPAPQEGQP
ncbi:NADH-quinone oxidoreductase subunit J [Xanthomonas translucens]|uniref:NADH-quinone oxidoreductase subunit J n=1 Tax=Xanthomonas campestris pv. translucens TaxID=343 RepID=UPI000641F93F|nr:NADH-quinone oxidoreductase subunit J [Xanthomonas translucens]AKK67241.1 NADH:ubiquinone oxidoreductase subunit J [Xanthomonas translucens pv. undulosa]AVY67350.1 NADH:ubiquinone oxidoreductase subunit J [Xanthomonas translucens pv. undulosa]MCT8269753.1 NADH-quinone oxidoreductase subunit J [Xanthomonas translucens pv. undulosa]QEN93145.1 NADH-quinone oxidoreductase subunit J [Xanthomonas translucens pv. undulosa]QEO25995.1 NADH-quinone oxidoreductase subunit J [Xanthomonas translucens pv